MLRTRASACLLSRAVSPCNSTTWSMRSPAVVSSGFRGTRHTRGSTRLRARLAFSAFPFRVAKRRCSGSEPNICGACTAGPTLNSSARLPLATVGARLARRFRFQDRRQPCRRVYVVPPDTLTLHEHWVPAVSQSRGHMHHCSWSGCRRHLRRGAPAVTDRLGDRPHRGDNHSLYMAHDKSTPDNRLPDARWRLDGRVAMVTGASSGLGARFTRVLHQAGANVLVTARRGERLDELASECGERIETMTGDITDARHREALAERLQSPGP